MRRSERMTALGAVTTATAVLPLSPLFATTAWWVSTTAAAATVALAGYAMRRLTRRPSAVVLAQVVALLFLACWVFTRDRLAFGVLPTPDAVHRLGSLVLQGVRASREYAPPAPLVVGLHVQLVLGTGALGILVDLIGVTLRQPAAAGLAVLAVYCVPVALIPEGVTWYWFVVVAAAYLMLVAADANDRVSHWGRVLGRRNPSPGGRLGRSVAPRPSAMAQTGRRAGLLVLAAAVVLPALVPGAAGGLMLPGSSLLGAGSGGIISTVNPILDLRANLQARSDATMLTYRTTGTGQPEPLRIATTDSFDGRTWAPGKITVNNSQRPQRGLPDPPGLASDLRSRVPTLRTDIVIVGLRQNYLPVPYPATRVDIAGPWLYDAGTLNIVGGGRGVTTLGRRYVVRSLRVAPDPVLLADSVPPPTDLMRAYTRLPTGIPTVVRSTALRVAGTGTDYQRAVRLQRFFRDSGGFTYSERAPDDAGSDAVAAFLTQRTGFCVHFASAMAVMARELGIPARVAVGFLPGRRRPDGTWVVTQRDSHAWPELYFQGVGWLRFEPTPAQRTQAPAWSEPSDDVLDPAPAVVPTAQGATAAPPTAPVPNVAGPGARPGRTTTSQPTVGARLRALPWRGIGTALLGLALLAMPWAARRIGSRQRWRTAQLRASRSGSPAGWAEAGWAELRERTSDLGVLWSPAATPRQSAARLHESADLTPDARQSLTRLVSAVERARFAAPAGWAGSPADPGHGQLPVVRGRPGPVAVLDPPRPAPGGEAPRPARGWDGRRLARPVGGGGLPGSRRGGFRRGGFRRGGQAARRPAGTGWSPGDDVRTVVRCVTAGASRHRRWRAALLPPSGVARLLTGLGDALARLDRLEQRATWVLRTSVLRTSMMRRRCTDRRAQPRPGVRTGPRMNRASRDHR